jgi:hypothetical protein
MKGALAMLCCLFLATVASAASEPAVTRLPKPSFPAPATAPTGEGRLQIMATRYRDPGLLLERPSPPAWAPPSLHGLGLQLAIRQPGTVFLVYGRDGSSGRFLVAADARTHRTRYALDFDAFAKPPAGGEYEPLVWARERGGVLYVSHAHLTYATATRGRNAYVSAIDVRSRKLLWRSAALVANARSFVLADDVVVAGYGFTAEPDFLYLLDRRSGRVVDRVALPTGPEWIKLRGDRLHVRTYDRDVVVQLSP